MKLVCILLFFFIFTSFIAQTTFGNTKTPIQEVDKRLKLNNTLDGNVKNQNDLQPHAISVEPTAVNKTDSSYSLIAIFVSIFALGISVIKYYKEDHTTKLETLTQAFKILNENNHRLARKIVYNEHDGAKDNESPKLMNFPSGISDERIIIECQAMVRADFDQMGSLFKNKHINRTAFLDAYWHTIILSWIALQKNINEERAKRENDSYMKNFEYLVYEAEKYKKKYHNDVENKFYCIL